MKVSMDGLRRSLSTDVRSLRGLVGLIVDVDFEFEDKVLLINTMNQVISDINNLNCCSSDDDKSFNDMSNNVVKELEDKP